MVNQEMEMEKDEIFTEALSTYNEIENSKMTISNLLNNAYLSIAKTKFTKEYQKYILEDFLMKSNFTSSLELIPGDTQFNLISSNKFTKQQENDNLIKRHHAETKNQDKDSTIPSSFSEISKEFQHILAICVDVANLSNKVQKLTEQFLS